jgi:hypothetical protein
VGRQTRQEQADRALEVRRGHAEKARAEATRAQGESEGVLTSGALYAERMARACEAGYAAAKAAHGRGASAAAIRSAYTNASAKAMWAG